MTAPDPRLTRNLPWPVATVAVLVLLAVCLTLLRLWHGTWSRLGAASLAPSLFGLGALALWTFERLRGRTLPVALTFPGPIALAALAGGLASFIAPTLGSVQAGVLGGVFWGTVIAFAWHRASKR